MAYRETPRTCSYLPDETASLEYRYLNNLDEATYLKYLERGWRRFGRVVFRPQCPTCRGCRSLRIDVNQFTPTKSQRRCLARNSKIELRTQPATVTPAHIELFNAYHRDMHQRRNWPVHEITPAEYHAEFADSKVSFAWETLYFQEDRLLGVGLVDVLPNAMSSVYFYHDPAWRPLGPGSYSVLREIDWARKLEIPYLYLGYWIERCPSMSYKSRFAPHELIAASVDAGESPVWKVPGGPSGT